MAFLCCPKVSLPTSGMAIVVVVLQAHLPLLLYHLESSQAPLGEFGLLLVVVLDGYPGLGCLERKHHPPIDAANLRRPHHDLLLPSW